MSTRVAAQVAQRPWRLARAKLSRCRKPCSVAWTSSSTIASRDGGLVPKNVDRNAAMPAIIATVEWASRSVARVASPDVHALGADPAEHREGATDVGDAGVLDLLFAQRVGAPQRQHSPRCSTNRS